jgi:regulatory protein
MTLDPDIKACAFRLLARREHSRHELRQKLLMRGYDAGLSHDVLDYLAKESWQSDVRFAESYVRSRINKGYGRLKIQAALQERAVASCIIATHLSQDDDFWFEQILHVWQKKFNMVAKFPSPEFMKQHRFLLSRGFTGEEIKRLWAFILSKGEQ